MWPRVQGRRFEHVRHRPTRFVHSLSLDHCLSAWAAGALRGPQGQIVREVLVGVKKCWFDHVGHRRRRRRQGELAQAVLVGVKKYWSRVIAAAAAAAGRQGELLRAVLVGGPRRHHPPAAHRPLLPVRRPGGPGVRRGRGEGVGCLADVWGWWWGGESVGRGEAAGVPGAVRRCGKGLTCPAHLVSETGLGGPKGGGGRGEGAGRGGGARAGRLPRPEGAW